MKMKLLHYTNRLDEVVGNHDSVLNSYHGDVNENLKEIKISLQSFNVVESTTYFDDKLDLVVTVITYY